MRNLGLVPVTMRCNSFHVKYGDGDPNHDFVLKVLWKEKKQNWADFTKEESSPE